MSKLGSEHLNLITRYAFELPEKDREQLLIDLGNSKVLDLSSSDSCIVFEIDGYLRPPYRGQHAYNVEGKVLDRDRAEVSVVLYADENNRLLELEFIRWDGGQIIDLDWEALQLYGSS